MSAKVTGMARTKYQHSGEGPPVRDRSGWILGPGDPPVSLPRGADATVIAAVRDGTLVKMEPITIETIPDEPEVPKRDDRGLLKVLIKLALDSGDEEVLTTTGKPTLDYLREEMESEGGDPEIVSGFLRDELIEEIKAE